MDIPHEKRFHFRDGGSAGSIEELQHKLEGIGYREFYHHVNAEKNDFANWIRHVFKEEELAGDLEKVSSIVESVEIINDFIHPRAPETPHEDIQSKIEEEALDIHAPTATPVDTTDETPAEETPAEELSETVQPTDFVLEETADESTEEASEEPVAKPTAEHDEHVLSQRDYTRLIVKDFMYGLVFGLIIGLIIGRILTF